MGLEDHYEEADGSPKQPRSEEVIPPVSVFFSVQTSISLVSILLLTLIAKYMITLL